MKRKFNRVYQFKISMTRIKPPILRRIQVPETYTFWDLHIAIQDVMGWIDYHLHVFEMVNPSTGMKSEIGIPDEEYEECGETLADWENKIADWFNLENRKACYTYDFGDNWVHTIILEKILRREDEVKYPICIKGKRACPPEDCGGVWRYEELLEAITDTKHEEHEEILAWVGGEFDPEHFDLEEVHFDDPEKRFKIAFE